jgi:adenylate kinase
MKTQNLRAAWFQGGDAPCRPEGPPPERPYRLVLLGPPGVGKGTQAELLSATLGTCHLSTGELFRAAQCQTQPSPALQAALEAMRRGQLVPDPVVVSMIRERVRCLRCHGGFLLDGFPRTAAQAEALDTLLKEQGVALDFVVFYELPLAEVVLRLSGRRTCPGCKTIYHLKTRPPRVECVCDFCGGSLAQREDDRPEAIQVRLQTYEDSIRPLKDYYLKAGKLLPVLATGAPEKILERTLQALHALPTGTPKE